MKKIMIIAAAALVLAALLFCNTAQAQSIAPVDTATARIKNAVFATPPDAAGLTFWWEAAKSKGIVRKIQRMDAKTDSVRAEAKDAKSTAVAAASQAERAQSIANSAASFKGKTDAGVIHDEIVHFAVAASSDTANPDYAAFKAIATSMARRQPLTKDQVIFASTKYLAFITKGASAGTVALKTVNIKVAAAEQRLTQTVRDTLAALGDLRQQVAELKGQLATLKSSLQAVAENTATALRVKNEEGNKPSKRISRQAMENLARIGRGESVQLSSQ